MLKSYNELRNLDITPYVKRRDNTDYLPWASCVDLLHQCGAERVYWVPVYNKDGSSLFMSDQVFTDKNGKQNRCYEVRIKVTVDDDSFEYSYPLTNGINPVKDDSLNQNVVFKACARAFVKAVAIRYGLGFSLWSTDEIEDIEAEEDLNRHSLKAIKERMEQEVTYLLQHGMSTSDIARSMGMEEEVFRSKFSLFAELSKIEKNLLLLIDTKK